MPGKTNYLLVFYNLFDLFSFMKSVDSMFLPVLFITIKSYIIMCCGKTIWGSDEAESQTWAARRPSGTKQQEGSPAWTWFSPYGCTLHNLTEGFPDNLTGQQWWILFMPGGYEWGSLVGSMRRAGLGSTHCSWCSMNFTDSSLCVCLIARRECVCMSARTGCMQKQGDSFVQ